MKIFTFVLVVLILHSVSLAETKAPELSYPLIKDHGGIADTSEAAQPPMKRAKVVLDITSDATEGGVLKGLDRAALILNLYAQAGIERDEGVALAIVLHGKATPFALSDEAYKKRHPDAAKNPNLELIRDLKKHGATVYVCAQSLARNGYAKEDVASEITVATSAIIANINLQNQGYACVPFH